MENQKSDEKSQEFHFGEWSTSSENDSQEGYDSDTICPISLNDLISIGKKSQKKKQDDDTDFVIPSLADAVNRKSHNDNQEDEFNPEKTFNTTVSKILYDFSQNATVLGFNSSLVNHTEYDNNDSSLTNKKDNSDIDFEDEKLKSFTSLVKNEQTFVQLHQKCFSSSSDSDILVVTNNEEVLEPDSDSSTETNFEDYKSSQIKQTKSQIYDLDTKEKNDKSLSSVSPQLDKSDNSQVLQSQIQISKSEGKFQNSTIKTISKSNKSTIQKSEFLSESQSTNQSESNSNRKSIIQSKKLLAINSSNESPNQPIRKSINKFTLSSQKRVTLQLQSSSDSSSSSINFDKEIDDEKDSKQNQNKNKKPIIKVPNRRRNLNTLSGISLIESSSSYYSYSSDAEEKATSDANSPSSMIDSLDSSLTLKKSIEQSQNHQINKKQSFRNNQSQKIQQQSEQKNSQNNQSQKIQQQNEQKQKTLQNDQSQKIQQKHENDQSQKIQQKHENDQSQKIQQKHENDQSQKIQQKHENDQSQKMQQPKNDQSQKVLQNDQKQALLSDEDQEGVQDNQNENQLHSETSDAFTLSESESEPVKIVKQNVNDAKKSEAKQPSVINSPIGIISLQDENRDTIRYPTQKSKKQNPGDNRQPQNSIVSYPEIPPIEFSENTIEYSNFLDENESSLGKQTQTELSETNESETEAEKENKKETQAKNERKHENNHSLKIKNKNESENNHSLQTANEIESEINHSLKIKNKNESESEVSHSLQTAKNNKSEVKHSLPTSNDNESGVSHPLPTKNEYESEVHQSFSLSLSDASSISVRKAKKEKSNMSEIAAEESNQTESTEMIQLESESHKSFNLSTSEEGGASEKKSKKSRRSRSEEKSKKKQRSKSDDSEGSDAENEDDDGKWLDDDPTQYSDLFSEVSRRGRKRNKTESVKSQESSENKKEKKKKSESQESSEINENKKEKKKKSESQESSEVSENKKGKKKNSESQESSEISENKKGKKKKSESQESSEVSGKAKSAVQSSENQIFFDMDQSVSSPLFSFYDFITESPLFDSIYQKVEYEMKFVALVLTINNISNLQSPYGVSQLDLVVHFQNLRSVPVHLPLKSARFRSCRYEAPDSQLLIKIPFEMPKNYPRSFFYSDPDSGLVYQSQQSKNSSSKNSEELNEFNSNSLFLSFELMGNGKRLCGSNLCLLKQDDGELEIISFGKHFLRLMQKPGMKCELKKGEKELLIEVQVNKVADSDEKQMRNLPIFSIIHVFFVDSVVAYRQILERYRIQQYSDFLNILANDDKKSNKDFEMLSFFASASSDLQSMKKFAKSFKDAMKKMPKDKRSDNDKLNLFIDMLRGSAIQELTNPKAKSNQKCMFPFSTRQISALNC